MNRNCLFNILALSLSIAHCEKYAIDGNNLDSHTSVDVAINATFAQETVNCSRYIPAKWIKLMQEYEPNDTITGHLHHVPEEFLIECLREELKYKNESSPFSFLLGGVILYNIAINEVVSLGFDGILVTKARESIAF